MKVVASEDEDLGPVLPLLPSLSLAPSLASDSNCNGIV